MAILANPDHFEREQRGDTNQVLVAVRYVGNSRRYSNRSAATQGLWPDYTSFLADEWYVGFVPEAVPKGGDAAGVAWFERSDVFEVEYDPERIAEILLDRNYVSLEPGGPIGEGETVPGFEAALQEALGIQPPHEAGATYADQLKAMAGVEDAPAEADDVTPEERLVNEHDRAELKEMVKEAREDAGEFSLRGASMEDMAAFLVEKRED